MSVDKFIEVIFFDVGQGNTTLVIAPDRKSTVLVDCQNGEAAKVCAYIEQHGLAYPEYIFISHWHSDHADGFADTFAYLLKHGTRVHRVYTNYVGRPSRCKGQAAVDQLRRLLDDDQNRLREFCSAEPPLSCNGMQLDLLHPDRFDMQMHRHRQDMWNELSGVVRIAFGKSSILLPGDIQGWAASRLVAVGGANLESTLLLFPHHGAGWTHLTKSGQAKRRHGQRLVSPDRFVATVKPAWTVLSVASDNGGSWAQWGHPSLAVLALLREHHKSAAGRFLCTEVTPRCCPGLADGRTECCGNIRFRLFRNGNVSLLSPSPGFLASCISRWRAARCN